MIAGVPTVILYLEVDVEKRRPRSEGGERKMKGTCTCDDSVDAIPSLNCLPWDFT